MGKIIKILPFVGVITLNVLAEAGRFKIEMLKPFVLIIGVILLLNLITAIYFKVKDYFTYGLSGVFLLGSISVFVIPTVGQFYLENIIVGLYLGLFSAAFFPTLFKQKPFTYYISKKNYPDVISNSDQFFKINNIMSYIWAGLFVIAMFLTTLEYSNDSGLQVIISTLIPIAVLLIIGILANIILPKKLMQIVSGERIVFASIKEASQAMPYGLNKELAKGIDTIVQFELTGNEPGTAHLIIKNQECKFIEGPHSNPATIIKADSKVWLDVTNNKISGDKAFINKMFEVEGDASIMLVFADLFAPKNEVNIAKYEPREMNYNYKTFALNKIKKIVVFDGGPRDSKFSKTKFMVDNFIKGSKKAGAEVEYFKLKDYKIHHCSGCYTCWTKTPGECVFKDDMTVFLKKYREADLVVFASPLYIFNVTGILKDFMDRLLPVLKPYMLLDEKGYVKHPDRFPEAGEQGFVVFSAAGFPDVEHNFDGLEGMFRMWDSHNENMYLMGEFFMTASEVIVQPVFKQRKENIEEACQKAGEQVVNKGKIDKKYMQLVSYPGTTKARFQTQADLFWETLDGKARYLKEVPTFDV